MEAASTGQCGQALEQNIQEKRARAARVDAKRSAAERDADDLRDAEDEATDWDPYDNGESSEEADQQEHMDLDGQVTSRQDCRNGGSPSHTHQPTSGDGEQQTQPSSGGTEHRPQHLYRQLAAGSSGCQHHISPGSEVATCNWIQSQGWQQGRPIQQSQLHGLSQVNEQASDVPGQKGR